MKFLRKVIAVLLSILMLMMPLGVGASAEAQDWQSLLLDVFEILLEEDEEADAYEDNGGYYDDREYGDGEETYYQYDWPITDPQQIVNYIYEFGCLPENFITKNEAREMGWDSSRNYVGDVAPDMSIGGDRFGNYEGLLPDAKGRTWYECDANYKGKKRGAERVVFSSDGLFYYTDDHYESFTEMFPEE